MLTYLELCRVRQWPKNFFVLAPLFFAFKFIDIIAITDAIVAFIAFIGTSSVVYIFNDIQDLKEDRQHPVKKKRPLASKSISVSNAILTAAFVASIAGLALYVLPMACTIIILVYLVMNVAYTTVLKYYAIIDIITIAIGFVLRVLMGGYAINVVISPWIILTTFLLALFLAAGKRYHEIGVKGYKQHRQVLGGYSKTFIDKIIAISCVASLLSYAIYTVEMASKTGHGNLVYTVIFVVFGLLRYLQHIYVQHEGGAPEKIISSDLLFILNGVLWLITTLWILV